MVVVDAPQDARHGAWEPLVFASSHISVLWGMAILLYGIGLATFGLHYWIPVLVVLGGAWAWLTWTVIILYCLEHHIGPGTEGVVLFAATSALLGLLLAAWGYRRWVTADVA